MLEAIRKRREDDEQGFTLIELMVVILIIAILIAIAIPTFLGAQKRAKDRAAQSDLRNALSAAKTLSTDFEGAFCKAAATTAGAACTELDAAALFAEEGALTFINSATPSGDAVGVQVSDYENNAGDDITNGLLLLTRRSKSGKYFGLTVNSDGGVKYCQGSAASNVAMAANTECPDTDW